MSVNTTPTNIGHGIDTCWIVDPNNHDRLVPIGAVGELLVEGPSLARGYLNNQQKTSESFVKNPRWAVTDMQHSAMQERRMYKTGDLVRYSPDDSGEMIYIGRKDNQAKLHGQRLELEEVEHRLNADVAVRHGLVTLPAIGNCARKLVAVVSLQGIPLSMPTSHDLEVLISNTASDLLAGIRERLGAHLPMYMIPSNWVVLRNLPLLPSGKLNRRHIEQFVESMSDNTYQQIAAVGTPDSSNGLEITDIERRLQSIWGHVLNLPPETVGLNCSFIHLVSDANVRVHTLYQC
jgi:acyl-CoA synthetase (AMP-forming)/AMP-acid ligase II